MSQVEVYFEWLVNIVAPNMRQNLVTHRKLLESLHNIPYIVYQEHDYPRLENGIYLRYKWGYDIDIPEAKVDDIFQNRPCSMLEMMIALSLDMEEIMLNDKFGNRTGQWFWYMVNSLGLGNMSDLNYRDDVVYNSVDNFINYRYEQNGKGGLFMTNRGTEDMRTLPLWHQAMRFLNEYIDDFGE